MTKIKGFFLLALCTTALYSHTIEEKREALLSQREDSEFHSDLHKINSQIKSLRELMETKYTLVNKYYENKVEEKNYEELLVEINLIRNKISSLEQEWHTLAIDESKKGKEAYALWDPEEVALSQLIIEYGTQDYLYIIPPDIFSMKLHVHSGIPIPRESWNELLEIILSHNGIGVKQLNAYTKQLYILKHNLMTIDRILTNLVDLKHIPPKSRIAYIFSPPPERMKGVAQFFEKFRDPKGTFVYQVGYKIAIVSSKEEVEKLLALYEAVWEKEGEKLSRVLSLARLKPTEMEKIITAYFGDITKKTRLGLSKGEGDDLIILPLQNEGALVLIGPQNIVEKAESLVRETEKQFENPMGMTVYLYNCRHSDPIDVANVLEKVYTSLVYSGVEGQEPNREHPLAPAPSTNALEPHSEHPLQPPAYGPPPYSTVVHPPTAIAATIESQKEKSTTMNFIPYPKTGAIMMVVRRDTLDKIKELIRKLDVPKKMVQIEVLLFEKRIKNKNNFGMNLLRLGSSAKNIHQTGLSYDSASSSSRRGIIDFFIFRKKPHNFWPAFDLAYNFLIAQEDVRINAAPSVTTLNQTPAQISLVEEISLDNGAAAIDTNKGIAFQQSFSRAQYGTTIVITPTIHDPEHPTDNSHFVTLETNISFDTIKKNTQNDRPSVSRRHVENQVRVVDGETVILGGLREKTVEDSSSRIPFLGELPGIGKFFGDAQMTNEKTEMFFFITPHIIFDVKGELDKLRHEQLMKRPGDLPEFLEKIQNAKNRYKTRLFDSSLELLFSGVDD